MVSGEKSFTTPNPNLDREGAVVARYHLWLYDHLSTPAAAVSSLPSSSLFYDSESELVSMSVS
jgi:hypothetical protein